MPQIKIVSTNCQQSELFLLEFQGKFETNENVPLNGMEIGRLDLSGVRINCIKVYISILFVCVFRVIQFIMLEIKGSLARKSS